MNNTITRAAAPTRSIWKGSLTLDLIDCQIKVYKACEAISVKHHQIAPDGSRIKQQRIDEAGNLVEFADIRKGYYLPDDDSLHAFITDDEVEALMPEASKTISILEFVPSVDPIYFEATYLIGHNKDDDKAPSRHALMCALIGDRVAIARWVYRQREHIVAIRHADGHLYLSTLYYEPEIREFPKVPQASVTDAALTMANTLAENLTADTFDMSKYRNEFDERLTAMVEARRAGLEYAPAVEPQRMTASGEADMEAVLKAMLEKTGDLSAVKTGIPGEALVEVEA